MYPIRFVPVYQEYAWGGNRIAKKYGRSIKANTVAESWEISDRSDGMSVVANGAYKGKTLHELVVDEGEKLLGVGQTFKRFPLLLKIIDAKENLSVQVHPDEASAAEMKAEPRTQMWYLLEEGSVFAGFTKGIDEKKLRSAIKANKVGDILQKFDLLKGQAILIPGGRVHAVGAGCLLLEVGQGASTTFTLYDWGQKGRSLQIEEAMKALLWGPAKVAEPRKLQSDLHHQLITIITSSFFVVERMDVFNHLHIGQIPKTFQIFFCLEGKATLSANGHKEEFLPGMTYLIPAACTGIEVEGKCEMLRVRLP